MGVQGGWGCAARAQTQRAKRAEIAHLMSSRGLCPAPRRSSLEVVDGGQLPDGGCSLRRRDIRISGVELHICASRPTRDASASRCAAMFEGLGHERGAHQRWSARSGAAVDCDVQVVRHRALRLQSRLAPDDDADACALARSEAGRRSNGPSVAPGVGRRSGQAALTCRSIHRGFGGRSTKIRFYSPGMPLGPEPNVPPWTTIHRLLLSAPFLRRTDDRRRDLAHSHTQRGFA